MVQQPNRLLSISGQRTNALAWGKVQTNASTGAWPSSWSALGGSLASRPTGGKFSDGRIVQFGVDSTGALWVQSQASANGAFGAWTKVANTTLADSPTVVSDASNNVLLFARTTADTMVVASYSPAGALSAWTSLGKPSTEALDSKSTPSVLVFNDRIRVFVTLPDGSVLSKLQDLGGVWTSSWQPVGDLKAAGPVAAVVERRTAPLRCSPVPVRGHWPGSQRSPRHPAAGQPGWTLVSSWPPTDTSALLIPRWRASV